MQSDDERRVRLYRESIRHAWKHGDTNVWPVKLNAALHLFVKEFGEEVLADLATLEARGATAADAAAAFGHPARIYRIIDSAVYSMRRNRMSIAAQRAVVLKLLAMTRALKHGSEFNEDGRNLIYTPAVAALVGARLLAGPLVSRSDSLLIHRFCGLMWAYTESIFFRAHDVTKEIHGPYECGPDRYLVKEYLNLRPVELWPDMPLLDCHSIRVFAQYDDTVRTSVDALSHVFHDGGALVPALTRCTVEIDGRPADLGELRPIVAAARDTVAAISHHVESIGWNERVLQYADIFWFRKKPLADLCGRDWRVPERVRDAIRCGRENERRRIPLTTEASERLAILTI